MECVCLICVPLLVERQHTSLAALRRFMERLKKLPLELEAPSTLPSVKPNEQSPRDAIEEIPSLLNRLVTALTGASVEAFSLDATIGLTKACEEVAAALGVLFESGSELSTEGSDLFSAAELKLALALLPEDDVLKCRDTIVALLKHEHGWVFATPVDPVELGLDDYFEIIEVPMDLGTIKTKLDTGGYNSSEEFESDVRLTFENATTYNSEGTVVHDMARELKKYFEDDLKKHPTHQRLVFKLGTHCGHTGHLLAIIGRQSAPRGSVSRKATEIDVDRKCFVAAKRRRRR